MKKLNFFVMLLAMILVFPLNQFAQDLPAPKVDVGVVADSNVDTLSPAVETVAVAQVPDDGGGGFVTFAALVALIPFAMQLFKKLIPDAVGWFTQICSWLVGIILTMFGWYFNLGFLADMTWWLALLYGFGASLAANGIFDIGLIEWILQLVGLQRKQT